MFSAQGTMGGYGWRVPSNLEAAMILTTAITGGRRAEREDAQREARLAGGDSKHATTLYYVGAATLFSRDPKKNGNAKPAV